jgi:hypothetical protein
MAREIDPLELRCTDLVRQNGRQGIVTAVTGGLVKIAWDDDDFVSVYSPEAFGALAGATATQKGGLSYGEPVTITFPVGGGGGGRKIWQNSKAA